MWFKGVIQQYNLKNPFRPEFESKLEVTRFLRNRGSQFLFLGNRATRIEGLIPEESRFTIPIFSQNMFHKVRSWDRIMVRFVWVVFTGCPIRKWPRITPREESDSNIFHFICICKLAMRDVSCERQMTWLQDIKSWSNPTWAPCKDNL